MSDLPDRDDPGSNFNRWEVWEAYKRGVLKSRDEMDEAKAMWALMFYRDKVTVPYELPGKILDAAWREVADDKT